MSPGPGQRGYLMNEALPHSVPMPSPWDIPAPVLLNTWKHHAGALRQRIAVSIDGGATGLADLARDLVVIGTELMDLYLGSLSPAEIAAHVLAILDAEDRRSPDNYRDWIDDGGGYRVVTLADDSRWVLRRGEETDRYVHIHPGRWAPLTLRVRANVLKTAILALAHAGLKGDDPLDLTLVNRVRCEYLGLAPLGRQLNGDQGIGAAIAALRSSISLV